MKEYCFISFLIILISIEKYSFTKLNGSLSNKELETLIEYLNMLPNKKTLLPKSQENKQSPRRHDIISRYKKSKPAFMLEPKFVQVEVSERGKGCEAMNRCSGKGACQNGVCMCDEGFDYFDCSISIPSKFIK